jgi:hypothetical protein
MKRVKSFDLTLDMRKKGNGATPFVGRSIISVLLPESFTGRFDRFAPSAPC